MKIVKQYPYAFIYSIFILINVVGHLLVVNNFEYHRDELLYFSLGNHLDFGYASVPPLIGWIAFMMQSIFGTSVFAVKLFPAILSGVYLYIAMRTSRELGGRIYAVLLTGIAVILMPINLRAFHLFQPVPIELTFWALIYLLSIRYVKTENPLLLMLLGLVFGFALLNKYLVGLLLISLAIALAISQHRNIYRKKELYLGMLIGFIVFLPNLIWQFTHGLPVIYHINELNESQLTNVDRLSFLIDQLLNPFAASLVIIPGFIFTWKNSKYRYIFMSSLMVIFILFILKGKSYYSAGIFLVLIASGAVFYENAIKSNVLKVFIPLIIVVLSIGNIPMGLPIYKPDKMVEYYKELEEDFGLTIGRRFEDGTIHSLPQDYADQLGWHELTDIVVNAYNRVPDKTKCLIYTENYGQAGAVSIIGKKYGLPEARSFSDSYMYWVPQQFSPDIEYFIYVNDEMGDDVKNAFNNIEVIGSITNPHAREFGTKVYYCTEPVISFNELWKSVLIALNIWEE